MKQQYCIVAHTYPFSILVVVMVAKYNIMHIYPFLYAQKCYQSASTSSIRRDIDAVFVFISTFQWKLFCKRKQNFLLGYNQSFQLKLFVFVWCTKYKGLGYQWIL